MKRHIKLADLISNLGNEDLFDESISLISTAQSKNEPTDKALWGRAKAEAKKKFKVYPSAYANAWASKWYKEKGGGWKKKNKAEDSEYNMSLGHLKNIQEYAPKIMDALSSLGEEETPEWVESKITQAMDDISEVWHYLEDHHLFKDMEDEYDIESTIDNIIQKEMASDKMDPVGKEDGDVDNDGDKDSSDEYLMKRRKKIQERMASLKKK